MDSLTLKTHTIMKNTLKNIWSVWNTTDKLVAILSILSILILCLTCNSCQAQPSNVPTMEYNDASGEFFDYEDIPGTLFFAEGVINFIYNTQEDLYIIEYNDPDAFDSDDMDYDTLKDYYSIQIFCDSTDFFDYLHWYLSITDDDEKFYLASTKYYIESYKVGDNYYYRLKHTNKQ